MRPNQRLITHVLAAIVLTGLVVPHGAASAATSPSPSVEGGAAAVMSGTTVRVSFPPFTLASGEASANRTVHARIVERVSDCNLAGTRLVEPQVSTGVPFRDLGVPYIANMAIPSRTAFSSIENYYLCAFQKGEVSANGRLTSVDSDVVTWQIRAGAIAPIAPPLPGTPVLVSGGTATGVPLNGRVVVSVALISPPSNGDALTSREVIHSVVNARDVASCAGGSNPTQNRIAASNTGVISLALTYPTGRVGQFLCVEQALASNAHPTVRRSTPLVLVITQGTLNPALSNAAVQQSLNSALTRVQQASTNLAALLAAGNANAPAVAAAIQEAQAAQEELQAARAAEALADPGNAINQGGQQAGVIENTPSDAPVNAAADQLRQQLEVALGGATVTVAPGVAPTLLSLADATGFDPLTTPVLSEGKSNAAGINLALTKPKKIKRGKDFYVTLKVDPTATRGGMRQYLLRMDGSQPTLVQKRSGFITTGQRVKRYKVPRKDPNGNYVLLSTFQPSVPGTPGLALVTPITVN